MEEVQKTTRKTKNRSNQNIINMPKPISYTLFAIFIVLTTLQPVNVESDKLEGLGEAREGIEECR